MDKLMKDSNKICNILIEKKYSHGEMIAILEVAKTTLVGLAIHIEIGEHIAKYHALDKVKGDEASEESDNGLSEAVNEAE